MRKKYSITIEEMVSKTFEVFAENDEQAESIAIEKYKSGEFVLDPGNLVSKQMQINNETEEYIIDWKVF